MINNGDTQSVRYADGVVHSQWVHRTLRSAVGVIINGRISGVIINGDTQSVRYADGVVHSQYVMIPDEDVRCVGGDKSDDGSVKGRRSK